MRQIPLQKAKTKGHVTHWLSCAPFVENKRGVLIHRPRTGMTVTISERWRPHIALGFWCGMSATGTKKFTFLDVPPENGLLCERCEQMAVKNGLPSADELAGRHVHIGKCVPVRQCCSG